MPRRQAHGTLIEGILPYRGLGSSIQRALEEWPEIGFVDDRDGCLFTATVRRTAEQETATGRVTGEVTGEVTKLLQALENGQMLRVEAQRALGLKSQANFRDRYLKPALDAGLIEMTIPDKPNSRLQKYRLTEVGRRLLIDAHRGEDE